MINGNLAEEITKLKAQPGKNLLLYAGAGIISAFIGADLIDEYRIRFSPLILGQGKSMFPHMQDRINLKPIQTKLYANGTILTQYVRKGS